MKRTLLWKRARRHGADLDLKYMQLCFEINVLCKTIASKPKQELTLLYPII